MTEDLHAYREDCYCLRCLKKRRLEHEAEAQAEADNALVHEHTQRTRTRTLADLYRAGRSKGLLKSIKGYN